MISALLDKLSDTAQGYVLGTFILAGPAGIVFAAVSQNPWWLVLPGLVLGAIVLDSLTYG